MNLLFKLVSTTVLFGGQDVTSVKRSLSKHGRRRGCRHLGFSVFLSVFLPLVKSQNLFLLC